MFSLSSRIVMYCIPEYISIYIYISKIPVFYLFVLKENYIEKILFLILNLIFKIFIYKNYAYKMYIYIKKIIYIFNYILYMKYLF